MRRILGRPSPAMVVAIIAVIAALAGTAVAGGVLTKKKVNKIITKRAPGLSVNHANTAGSATRADSATEATSADSVGGVSIEPVRIALPEGAPETPVVSVDGSEVSVSNCGSGQVTLRIARAFGGGVSPPITMELIVPGAASSGLIANGNASSTNAAVIGLSASIRQSSGRVTLVFLDVFYEANAFGGPDDCFVQGTIERFG